MEISGKRDVYKRQVPLNTQTPKALIEVNGEILIERLLKQLHEVGITEIYIVVGFLKEEFEYLICLLYTSE